MLFLLQISTKWCQTCSRSNKNSFIPFHCISKGRFPQLCLNMFGIYSKIRRYETIIHQTSQYDRISMFLRIRSDSKQPGSHRIRQLNKILKGDFDLKLFNQTNQTIPLFWIACLCNSLVLCCCFGRRVLNKVIYIVTLEFTQLLENRFGHLPLQINSLAQQLSNSTWYEIQLQLLILVDNIQPYLLVEILV